MAGDGVRRVVVTAPSVDVPMVIMGVNEDKLQPDQKVISSASSTLYCLAPIIKVLENDFGVSEGFVTSIHAMTPSLKPLDGLCLRGKHWRDYRSIHQNIIPATTGACKALGKILPQLRDKLVGLAFRVPIVNVSVLDLTVRLNKDTSLERIVESVKNASKTYLKGVLDISNEEAVSSDFIKDSHSCILDVNSSIKHKPNFYKLICWYENEFSYACRVIDTILYSERQLYQAQIAPVRINDSLLMKKNLKQHSPGSFRQCMSFGEDCSANALPNVLRNYSKIFDFKIKSHCNPLHRKMPATTRISVMNQTTITTNLETKSKSDVFKIIDYDSVPATSNLEQNMQNCNPLKLMNADQTEKEKVHDRLVNVKKEVNKMMNMTEKLIKKSNKLNNYDACKCKLNNEREKNTKTEEKSGDTQSNLNDNEISTAPIPNHLDSESKNYSNYRCKGCFIYRYEKELNDDQKSLSNDDSTEKGDPNMINCGDVNKNIIAETKSLICFKGDGKLKNEDKTLCDKGSEEVISSKPKVPKQASAEPQNEKSHYCMPEQISNPNIQEDIMTNKNCEKQNKHDEIAKVGNINISKDDINIAKLLRNNSVEYSTKRIIAGKIEDFKIEQDESETLRPRTIDIQNIILKKNLPGKYITLHSCQENINTSIKTYTNKPAQDIYDKLDSTSATNSENSFDVNEKQSQVIYINDLTNSLEDLGRLEKICKIIEISDDLSDDLFAKLQVNDSDKSKSNKWSFKDLCDKIDLDDFCNKIFRETNV